MENISINSLFPKSRFHNRSLDVYSLCNPEENKLEDVEFSVKQLILDKQERQQRIYDEYRRLYRICLSKITLANKINRSNLIHEVPLTVYGCTQYIPIECLDYIKTKLDALGFTTDIQSETKILIDWKNIEDKKNKEEE